MTRPHPGLRAAAAIGLLGAALALGGCLTRTVRTPIFEENFVEVFLRQQVRGGEPVDRGFSQPATVSPVRMTNILARIEVRKKDEKDRMPAVPTDVIYAIGEGVSQALAKANSSQEVVVMAKQRKRSMGVFTQDYLTSLVVWAEGEKVYVKLGLLDEPLSKNPNAKVPEPRIDDVDGDARAVPSDGISVEGAQIVAAHWRDPLFRDSSVLRIRPGGNVVRRTVLMDSGPDASIPPEPATGAAVPPQGLSPMALRALADLEEERRRGQVTEADYQARRRQILSGDLPQAAPAADAPAPVSEPAP